MSNVDLADLACRESESVFDWYHADWFYRDSVGTLHFTPPAFEFRNGRLLGINGRHRTVLLCRHLEVFPMLLVLPDTWPKDKFTEIVQKQIKEIDPVELPDLPVNGIIKGLGELAGI